MRVPEEPTADVALLSFDVHHGNKPNGVEHAAGLDREAPPHRSDSETEAFWAGRNTAARFSARVAA